MDLVYIIVLIVTIFSFFTFISALNALFEEIKRRKKGDKDVLKETPRTNIPWRILWYVHN